MIDMQADATVEFRSYATTQLSDFDGAALLVTAGGQVRGANLSGGNILSEFDDHALCEITTAAGRAIAAGSLRMERVVSLGAQIDTIILPLADKQGAMVLIASDALAGATKKALIESRRRYQDLVQATSDFVWETDSNGRFIYLSGEAALGYQTRAMLGRPASDFVVDASLLPYPVFQTREPVLQTDVWLYHADGKISCQAITAVPVFDDEGEWCGTRGMGRDVTKARDTERTERQRQLRDRLLNYLADTLGSEAKPERTLPAALSGVGLAINAEGGMILKGKGVLSLSDAIAWGETFPELDLDEIQQALAEEGAIDLLRHGWQVIGHATYDSFGMGPRLNGAVLFWGKAEAGFGDGDRAILEEVATQVGLAIARLNGTGELVRQSHTDELTGLMNRRAFLTDLRRRMRRLARAQGAGTLLFIDLKGIKELNLVQGYAAGDQSLLSFSDILRDATRPTDLIGRVGGDHFAAWLEGVGSQGAAARAQALLIRCQPLTGAAAGEKGSLKIAVGVDVFDSRTPQSMETLIDRAHEAVLIAKARPVNSFEMADLALPSLQQTLAVLPLRREVPLVAGKVANAR